MKQFLIVTVILLSHRTFSQAPIIAQIKSTINKVDAEAHLTFLASDELRGRGTGTPEIAIAANYIATQFKLSGVGPVPGSGYFQDVGLQQVLPARVLELATGVYQFHNLEDLVLLKGNSLAFAGDMVFVGYGNKDDFEKSDVKGKVAIALAGSSEKSGWRQSYMVDGPSKYKFAQEKGAIALVEIATFQDISWHKIRERFSGPAITLVPESSLREIPYLWMSSPGKESLGEFIQNKGGKGSLQIEVPQPVMVTGKNVVGLVEGTDPKLKSEYIVLSAHYDHLGVKKNNTPDSIYNGARDNAIGTTAILEAAKLFGKNPSKRSVLLIAFCAEEKGLLGSKWYSDHPLVPLSQTVYNLDCDGAGYNDKTRANLVDLNRTTADGILKSACEAFGLTLYGDPAPEMNLYERSDNFNFAVKGVPAVDFSPGVKALDESVMMYYHQPADEAQSLDFDYLEKFFRSYAYAATLLSNAPVRPFWKPGDKFEEAGKKLYGVK